MDRFLPKIYLDFSSFWAGILITAIVIFLILRYRLRLVGLFTDISARIRLFRDKVSISTKSDYLRVLYKYAQTKHIFNNLFPLDSIVISPKCIAPPPTIIPGEDLYDPSLLQQTIGYDPSLPDLAIEYFAPTFSLPEALINGANLALLGYPGTGKTVAIADCISSLIKESHNCPELTGKIPFFVEAQQILLQFPGIDVLEILMSAIQAESAFSTIPDFPNYLTTSINSGKAILFIDGFDTLNHSNTNQISNYLISFCKKIPKLQVVVAASPTYLGTLSKAPFEFVSIAPWGQTEKLGFLDKFSKRWAPNTSDSFSGDYDKNQILNRMISANNQHFTPLEFSLNSWAAYSGDLSGPQAIHAIQSYLNRISSSVSDSTFKTLENIAVLLLEQEQDSFSKRDIISLLAKRNDLNTLDQSSDKTSPVNREIQIALTSKILQKAGPDRLYFSYPTIGGFLAARGLSRADESTIGRIISKPECSHFYETMRFFSAFNKIGSPVKIFLADQSLFKEKLIHVCHWLKYSKLSSTDLVPVLKVLTSEINNNQIFLVQLRVLTALAKSGNPNVKNIVRHLLQSQKPDTRRAAAICAGYIQDLGSVQLLINQLNDTFPCSAAACYALGKIGSPQALEAIAESLLQGDELLRRSAAETLSHNRSEGHPALREGATMDDLMVRYAVVHGLGLIKEDWSLSILEKMQINEDEWIVRDLARHVFEIHQTRSPFLPHPQIPLHQAAWLRQFAEQHNLAMLSSETAVDLLLKALEIGSEEQIQASMPYLRRLSNDKTTEALLSTLKDSNPSIQQLAAVTIWCSAPPGYISSHSEPATK